MDEFNLDFLKTPPKQSQHADRIASPFVYNEIDVKFQKKKYDFKKYKMAKTIARVDELVQEIDKLKIRNIELQKQLKDLQTVAQQVKELYTKEKDEHSAVRKNYEKMQKEHRKMDVDLTNITMVNEQIKARLAEYDDRPINFDNLVVKYVRIMSKLEGEDILRYSQDKDLVERLREYCATMKIKIPPVNSPKKSRSRGHKVKTQDSFMQCDLLGEIPYEKQLCPKCEDKPKVQDQSIQCSSNKCDQGSQYISTMVTRQTNTEKVLQKHVQTMFPEIPAVDDILKVYTKWSNIRSVSPLLESPSQVRSTLGKDMLKKFSTIGTCTMLCNIRRKIDYLPLNNSSNIKQEVFTPSASPTPPSYSVTGRARVGSLSNNMSGNNNSSTMFNLLNSTTNSSLGQLSTNAFNELWHIFGKMLFSLLQTTDASVANINPTSALNQQQFLDWLLEQHIHFQPQTTSTVETQTVGQIEPNVSTSPVCFNDSTMLLSDVVRPQPQRTLIANSKIAIDSSVPSTNVALGSSSTNTNSTTPISMKERQQLPSTSNTIELWTNTCESNIDGIHQTNTSEGHAKSLKNSKTKLNMLGNIQALLPGLKLNKKKIKALKRLFKKSSSHRKKLHESRKRRNMINKTLSSVVKLSNENHNDSIETAVDFLKTFVLEEDNNQPLEVNVSENEKIFLKECSNDCISNNLNSSKSEELTCKKRFSSIPDAQHSSNTSKDTIITSHMQQKKCKVSEISDEKQHPEVLNKPENEFRKQKIEIEICIPSVKPMIENTSNTSNDNSKCIAKECKESTKANICGKDSANKKIIHFLEDTNFSLYNEHKQSVRKSNNFNADQVGILTTNDLSTTTTIPTLEVEPLQKLNCNKNKLVSTPVATQLSASDIEKDLELPSDNESLISENDYNATHTLNSYDMERSKDKELRKENFIPNSLSENEDFEKGNSNAGSISNCNIKQRNANNLNNIEEHYVEKEIQENKESIYIVRPEVEYEKVKQINQNLQTKQTTANKLIYKINSPDLFEDNSISVARSETLEAIEIYEPKQQLDIDVDNYEDYKTALESNSDTESEDEIHKQSIDSIQTLIELDDTISNIYTQSEDHHMTIQTVSDQKCSEEGNSATYVVENNIEANSKDVYERDPKASSPRLTNSTYNESTIQSKSEDNSFIWSTITISDSSLNNETLNKPELQHTPLNTEVLPKISSPNNLKLLDSNNTHNHKKILVNSMEKTTTIENVIVIPKNLNIEVSEPKDKNNSVNGYQVATTNTLGTTINKILNNINTVNYHQTHAEQKLNYELDSSDSLSIDNVLMIDEDPSENSFMQLEADQSNSSTFLTEPEENTDPTANSTNISNLLNSSLYGEVLTESLNPIVNDLLKEEFMLTSVTTEIKPRRGCKRKSESIMDFQPCKRSERLKAKQMLLEKSLNLDETSIELTNCIRGNINAYNIPLKSDIKEYIKAKNLKPKNEIVQNSNWSADEKELQMGYFKERDEEEVSFRSNKPFTVIETQKPVFLQSNEQAQQHHIRIEAEDNEKSNKNNEGNQSNPMFESGQERAKANTQMDDINMKSRENCIYSNSPQSPALPAMHDNQASETSIIIPLERLPHLMPQYNNLTLFDVLINSYNKKHQRKILESVAAKKCKRKEKILNRFGEELNFYCYNEMELDLYCTSTQLTNKLLSIAPDYSLIQKAVLTIAQNAEGANVPEKDLPSIIQEMPPRHLSKCLQRLFSFLKNLVTRNSNFCEDLMHQIETLLFHTKQSIILSLQAILNLTQLYLMACKVQEYLQMTKHPARLFIAKCLYFYTQKSVLMVHEVLMWYPTVLPHREDKTYDRSDALISVIQQILMNTKYDMDKSDLRGKSLLSKLRYEYHFEPFRPSLEEVIHVLVEKLKNSKFYNISMAFGLLCKRISVATTEHIVLNQHLMPLANEYYSLALTSNEYDKRIEVLLEIISMLVKPLPIETDSQKYFNEFARFLNGFESQIIQEAALCSIIRLQRFNVEYCYKLLQHFQPTYDLNTRTQAMLKTFLYRRPLKFWMNLKSQNPIIN